MLSVIIYIFLNGIYSLPNQFYKPGDNTPIVVGQLIMSATHTENPETIYLISDIVLHFCGIMFDFVVYVIGYSVGTQNMAEKLPVSVSVNYCWK